MILSCDPFIDSFTGQAKVVALILVLVCAYFGFVLGYYRRSVKRLILRVRAELWKNLEKRGEE